MLFNSHIFLWLFLPATFAGYWALNARRLTQAALAWLLAASLVFYAWWKPVYLPLFLLSIAVNFVLSRRIEAKEGTPAAKAALLAGLAFNLGLLGWFKYKNFFLANAAALAGVP